MKVKISAKEYSSFKDTVEKALTLNNDIKKKIKILKQFTMAQFLGIDPGIDITSIDGLSSLLKSKWPLSVIESALNQGRGITIGPRDPDIYKVFYADKGIPIITPLSINELRINESGIKYLHESAKSEYPEYFIPPAGIICSCDGDFACTSAIVPIFHSGCMLGHGCISIMIDASRFEAFYILNVLHYYYNAGILKKLIMKDSNSIDIRALMSIPIPVPGREEQKKIADELLTLSGKMNEIDEYSKNLSDLLDIASL